MGVGEEVVGSTGRRQLAVVEHVGPVGHRQGLVDVLLDQEHPDDALWMLGLKTTCRDRWRQVLQEAPRLRRRHLLTLQAGVSGAQLRQMQENGVTLVVPRALHDAFAPDDRPRLLTVAKFVETVRDRLRAAR